MKRYDFENATRSDKDNYVQVPYLNTDNTLITGVTFDLNMAEGKAMYAMARAAQTLYDHACAYSQKHHYDSERFTKGFSNSELAKIKKNDPEDAVNKVIFSVAVNIQTVLTSIQDAFITDNIKFSTIIAIIIVSLKKALGLKTALKILDNKNLAPEKLTKNTIEMARHLRNTLSELKTAVSELHNEYSQDGFLERLPVAQRAAFKIATALIQNIHKFANKSYTNFDQAIKAYENKHPIKAKTAVPSEIKSIASSTPKKASRLKDLATVKQLIDLLKKQIKDDQEELQKRQLAINHFSPLSLKLQKELNIHTKENAEKLMAVLDKANPYPALRITCNQLKSDYDKECNKRFNSKKQMTALFNHLWSALMNHVNGTINENNKQIPVINEKITKALKEVASLKKELLSLEKRPQEATAKVKAKPAAHIFTKAFWMKLWNKIQGFFTRSPRAKPATDEKKESLPNVTIEAPKTKPLELDAPSFQSAAFSSPAPKRARKVAPTPKKAENDVFESVELASIAL